MKRFLRTTTLAVAILATAAMGTPRAAMTLQPGPVEAGDRLQCVLRAMIRATPHLEAEAVGELPAGGWFRASGETAAGDGGWVEREEGGWLLAARVDHSPEAIDGDLLVGQEGLVAGRVIPDDWAPTDLVAVADSMKTPGYEGRSIRLRAGAADAFRLLVEAAAVDGVTIQIFSAYRTAAYQRRLYGRSVDRDPTQITSAPPGRSEHRLGTTVDVSTPGARYLHAELSGTPAGRWIKSRAAEFGVVVSFSLERHEGRGVAAEPWHLRWVGEATADEAGW